MPPAEPLLSDAVMPRSRVIRDPVLGYVDVPGELDALVRSPAVQRLRNIAQNSRAIARYPSMSGSRFEHALGTMHLARKGWGFGWHNTVAPAGTDVPSTRDDFRREVIEAVRAMEPLDARTAALVGADSAAEVAIEDTPLWRDFEHVVGLVVGAVGLLHDLGHPPFSHILEPFFDQHAAEVLGPSRSREYADYRAAAAGHVQFHEWAGREIFDAIPADVFTWLPRTLLRAVLADRSDRGWASCLHSIIDGQFDVDRLDYLVRDAVNAGTEFGAIDSDRLLSSLELHRVDGGWKIGLGARAVSAFETLLVQRAQQYRWVVHHYAVIAANTALERAVRNAYELSLESGGEHPDFDYLSASPLLDRRAGTVCDDHDCIAWLRATRPRLSDLAARTDDAPRARKAQTTATLLDVCDSFSVTPIPAWRNYQEFLARADQNSATVEALVEATRSATSTTGGHLRSAAARDAVSALLADLPARLNAALDERLDRADDDRGIRAAEEFLTRLHPEIPVCGGAGFWLLTRVPFMALKDDFANIWRGDEEVGLSELSPFPLALTAIEVMRPRYFVYFVPFDRSAGDATKQQRREVGRLFFEALAASSDG